MKNDDLRIKIINKIHCQNYKLKTPIQLDDELFTHIIINTNEPVDSFYHYVVSNNFWEIPLKALTNRELIKLLQSL